MIDLLVILSGVMDTVTDGTSPVRPLLFLLFLLSITLASRLPNIRHESTIRVLAVAAVTLLFAASFLLQLVTFAQAGIPQHALAIAITQEEITNTRLTHIHLGKVALQALIPGSLSRQFDTGAAMMLLVPNSAAYLIGILCVAALLFVPYVLSRRVKEISERRWACLLLVSIVGFTALTKAIDGGILSDGAIIAYVALLALVFSPLRLFTTYLSFGAIIFAVAIAIAHLSGFYWGEGYAVSAVLKGGALLLILLALHHIIAKGMSVRSVALTVCAVVVVAAISFHTIGEQSAYLNRIVEKGNAMVRLNDGTVIPGDIYIGMTTRDIVLRESLTYWYQPVTHRSNGCSTEDVSHNATFILAPQFAPQSMEVRSTYAELHFMKPGDRYYANLEMAVCVPERIKEIQALLAAAGLKEAVIYGLEGGEAGPRNGDNNR